MIIPLSSDTSAGFLFLFCLFFASWMTLVRHSLTETRLNIIWNNLITRIRRSRNTLCSISNIHRVRHTLYNRVSSQFVLDNFDTPTTHIFITNFVFSPYHNGLITRRRAKTTQSYFICLRRK